MGITGSKSTESLDGSGPSTYEQRDDAYAGDASQETLIPIITQEELAAGDPENKIPMVFRWNYPAQDVWVAGTFTGGCGGSKLTNLADTSLCAHSVPVGI